MNNIYEFLSFLENNPTNLTNIYHFKHNTGKEYFDYCIQYGLITSKKKSGGEELKNSLGETLYRLSDNGEKLQKSKNFIECLKQIESEVNEKWKGNF